MLLLRLRSRLCLLPALALSSLLGCATKPAPASSAVKPAAAEIVMYDGLPGRPYRKIREVRTMACARQLGREPEHFIAREKLRVEAVRLGGNAVGNIMCATESAPAESPCWKIAQCTGEVESLAARQSMSNPK